MIVLDTNVLSEIIRPRPDAGVAHWVDNLDRAGTVTTAMTAAELRYGVARLPEGSRRAALSVAVERLLDGVFRGRIEPFDDVSSVHYAEVMALRGRAGRPIETRDAQIAAICLSRGATLATRTTKDFDGTGVQLVNPWET